MVIDTSALIAVLIGEADTAALETAIAADPKRLMSAASVLEASIVMESRYGEDGTRELELAILRLPIEVAPVDSAQLDWARHAYRTYGKGRHKAALNFGDCFSYALAKLTGEPLLFTGNDFRNTDVACASSAG